MKSLIAALALSLLACATTPTEQASAFLDCNAEAARRSPGGLPRPTSVPKRCGLPAPAACAGFAPATW